MLDTIISGMGLLLTAVKDAPTLKRQALAKELLQVYQGIGNELIQALERADGRGRVRRRQRLGGILNYYYRAA